MKRTLTKAAAAFLLVCLPLVAAFALNFDQTRTPVIRLFGSQQIHYYRLTYNWNDPGLGTAQKFGALGKNTFITDVACYVTTAFNASSTHTLSIGTSSTVATEIIAASGAATAAVDITSPGDWHLTAAAGLGEVVTSGGDVTLYSKLSLTGTSTAGLAACVIQFAPNNDL